MVEMQMDIRIFDSSEVSTQKKKSGSKPNLCYNW